MRKFLPFVVSGLAAVSFSALAQTTTDVDANTKIKGGAAATTDAIGAKQPPAADAPAGSGASTGASGDAKPRQSGDLQSGPTQAPKTSNSDKPKKRERMSGKPGKEGEASTGASGKASGKQEAAGEMTHEKGGASAGATGEAKKSDSQGRSPGQ